MLDQIFETVKIFANASDLSPRPEMLSITISLSNTTFSPKQVSLQGDTFLCQKSNKSSKSSMFSGYSKSTS